MTQDLINILANGRETRVSAGISISDFLLERKLKDHLVVVELNQKPLSRAAYSSTFLKPEDQIEIVQITAGG